MGQLINKSDIHSAAWYFHDAHYGNDKYLFAWPSPSFPFTVSIHQDIITNSIRIQIRQWVEMNLRETVIYDTSDLSYKKFFKKPHTWEHQYEVRNNWLDFYFENEGSMLLFKITFSEILQLKTKYHPTSPEDKEWVNKPINERMYG